MPTPDQIFESEEIASNYTIENEIGRGGMGVVYRAVDTLLSRVVAIKVLSQTQDNEQGRQRFLREIKLLSGMDHPNIVKLYRGGLTRSDRPWLVMELVEGRNLGELIKSSGALSVAATSQIFSQVFSAVEYAHQRGIIHRDITPSNIVLVNDGTSTTVKLLDFGLARSFAGDSSEQMKLTSTGTILGNPAYMSPEQSRGDELTPQSDLYSCACVIYECLTGHAPFPASNALEVMYKHLNLEPDLTALPKVGAVRDLLTKGLAKDASLRFEAAHEFSSALASCAEAMKSAETVGNSSKTPQWVRWSCALILILFVCFGFKYFSIRETAPKSKDSYFVLLVERAKKQKDDAWHTVKDKNKIIALYKAAIANCREAIVQARSKQLTEKFGSNLDRCRQAQSDAYRVMAGCYRQLGEVENAKKYFLLSLQLSPDQSFYARAMIVRDLAVMLDGYKRSDEAEEAYTQIFSMKLKDDGDYHEYANLACSYADTLASYGKFDKSTFYAKRALEMLKKCRSEDNGMGLLCNALIASNAWRQGHTNEMKPFVAQALLYFRNTVYSHDDVEAGFAAVILARALYDKKRDQSEWLFEKGLQFLRERSAKTYLAKGLEIFAEVEISNGNRKYVQDTVRELLNDKLQSAHAPFLRAVCYKFLAQTELAKRTAANAEKSDVVCSEYLRQAAENFEKAQNPTLLIEEITLLKARLEWRQSFEVQGEQRQRLKENARADFKKCLLPLLLNYDYWQRKSVKDGANEYRQLVLEMGQKEEAHKIERLIQGDKHWPAQAAY